MAINELLASNGKILADEDGDFEDWMELYNPTADPIQLEGYTLTDDPQTLTKWAFPSATVPPKGFLFIWASGKDRRPMVNWDFPRPLLLEFESRGANDGSAAKILVNRADKSLNGRGMNIVRLDEQGHYIESQVFDTYRSSQASDRMASYLSQLKSGEIVLIAVKEDAATQLTPLARSVLRHLGSEQIDKLGVNDSWGMISIAGRSRLSEDYKPANQGPATGSLASRMTLHTNFKLNKDGEYLGLYKPDGTVVDSLNFREQVRDVSFGRQPDGGETWCLFSEPTPNASNSTPCASGIAQAPTFSISSGLYPQAIQVALVAPVESDIRYTLDGSIPTEESPRYVEPLVIDKTQIVRARAFRAGLIPSAAASHTYLIGEDVHLPVLSLITDPANLWDLDIGIYTEGRDPRNPNYMQHGPEWERPVSVEFFDESRSLGFALDAGIRIHGSTTRLYPKKSFILYFRNVYGQDRLQYQVFPEKDIDAFTSLIVRNGGNDGEDGLTHMRDPLMHALWAEEGGLVSATRWVFVYLNGGPWGMYDLRENIDKDYLAANFDVTDADLLKETRTIEAGDAERWDALLSFFETSDLRLDENFQRAQSLMDVHNFTDYELFQIYAGNIDLVDANLIRFRPRTPDGRWRWIMWDVDFAFGLTSYNPVSHNTLAWETRDRPRPDLGPPWDDGRFTLWHTMILRKLLDHNEYRTHFINRFADLLNTTLHPDPVIAQIDSFAALLEPDIPLEMARWSSAWGGSLEEWLTNVEQLRDFARRRPHYMRHYIIDEFGLTGIAFLTIEPPSGAGSVQVNTITPASYPWHGQYFQGIPVTLQAKPALGYQFAGWSDPTLPNTPTVTVPLPEFYSVRALFVSQ